MSTLRGEGIIFSSRRHIRTNSHRASTLKSVAAAAQGASLPSYVPSVLDVDVLRAAIPSCCHSYTLFLVHERKYVSSNWELIQIGGQEYAFRTIHTLQTSVVCSLMFSGG